MIPRWPLVVWTTWISCSDPTVFSAAPKQAACFRCVEVEILFTEKLDNTREAGEPSALFYNEIINECSRCEEQIFLLFPIRVNDCGMLQGIHLIRLQYGGMAFELSSPLRVPKQDLKRITKIRIIYPVDQPTEFYVPMMVVPNPQEMCESSLTSNSLTASCFANGIRFHLFNTHSGFCLG